MSGVGPRWAVATKRRGAAATAAIRRIVAGTLFTAAIVAIAAVAAWPVYRTGWFLLLVGVSTVVAAGIAVLVHLRGWGGWMTAAALAVAFLLFGIPLAVPSRLGGFAEILRGFADARDRASSSDGRTSSPSIFPSGPTAICWCRRSWSSSSAHA